MKIRAICEADVPALRRFVEGCPPLDLHSGFTYWVLAKYHNPGSFVLTDDQGQILGLATGIRASDPAIMYLWQVGVAASIRGKGESCRLISKVVEAAIALGCQYLEYSIDPVNLASRAAFESVARSLALEIEETGTLSFQDGLVDHNTLEAVYRMRLTALPSDSC